MSGLPEAKGHHAHLSPAERLKILNMVMNDNLSYREVARLTGHNHSTVSRTVAKFNETGEIVEHVSGGRNTEYEEDDLYRLDCLIDQNPSASAATLIDMMGTSAPQISEETMCRYRKALGFSRRRPHAWQSDTARTTRERLSWAREHEDDDHLKWAYMDESTLCLRDTGDFVWVKRGQETP